MCRATINGKRIYQWSMVNGHLSFGRCKPLACEVLIEFGAGEVLERGTWPSKCRPALK
jgi:hypothetical protein